MPGEKSEKLGLEADIRSIDHFAAGNDDNVDGAFGLVVAEQLAREAFRPVALDRRAHLAGCGNAKARRSSLPIPREHRHEAAGPLESCLIDEFEISSLSDVLIGSEASHRLVA